MTDDNEYVSGLADAARETWEHVVERDGRKAEWTPKLALMDDAGDVTLVGIVADIPDGVEVSTRDMAVDAASNLVTPSTRLLAATLDTYIVSGRGATLAAETNRSPGDLYRAGHPDAHDALIVIAVDRRGKSTLHAMPYRIRGHRVHWIEVAVTASQLDGLGGPMAEALAAVMTRAGN